MRKKILKKHPSLSTYPVLFPVFLIRRTGEGDLEKLRKTATFLFLFLGPALWLLPKSVWGSGERKSIGRNIPRLGNQECFKCTSFIRQSEGWFGAAPSTSAGFQAVETGGVLSKELQPADMLDLKGVVRRSKKELQTLPLAEFHHQV